MWFIGGKLINITVNEHVQLTINLMGTTDCNSYKPDDSMLLIAEPEMIQLLLPKLDPSLISIENNCNKTTTISNQSSNAVDYYSFANICNPTSSFLQMAEVMGCEIHQVITSNIYRSITQYIHM